jgi:hypothetical protein
VGLVVLVTLDFQEQLPLVIVVIVGKADIPDSVVVDFLGIQGNPVILDFLVADIPDILVSPVLAVFLVVDILVLVDIPDMAKVVIVVNPDTRVKVDIVVFLEVGTRDSQVKVHLGTAVLQVIVDFRVKGTRVTVEHLDTPGFLVLVIVVTLEKVRQDIVVNLDIVEEVDILDSLDLVHQDTQVIAAREHPDIVVTPDPELQDIAGFPENLAIPDTAVQAHQVTRVNQGIVALLQILDTLAIAVRLVILDQVSPATVERVDTQENLVTQDLAELKAPA